MPAQPRVTPPRAKTTRALDTMDFEKYARSIVAINPSLQMVEELFAQAAPLIDGMADIDCVMRVYLHNPEALTVFARQGEFRAEMPKAEGFVAMLPLNQDGHRALFDGRLDTGAPDTRFICRQSEIPSAVYIWAIYTPPRLAGGVALIMERLSSKKYRTAPLYCKAANVGAERFFLTLGFEMGSSHAGYCRSEILHYDRVDTSALSREVTALHASDVRPIYNNFDLATAGPKTIGIKAVHCVDELVRVLSIRAVAYVGEQEIPFDEDVDGNDLTGTHLIGYVGKEPAGCIRIRYFADFVKIERLAVLPRFRRSRLAFKLIEAAIAFARKKGYVRFYGQAEESVIPLWRHFGFVPRNGEALSYMTTRRYREGDLFTESLSDALRPDSGGYVLVRREGEWDAPGIYEQIGNG